MYAGACEMHRSGVAVEGGEAGAVVEVCLGRGATCSFKRPLQPCLGVRNPNMNLCRCSCCFLLKFPFYPFLTGMNQG